MKTSYYSYLNALSTGTLTLDYSYGPSQFLIIISVLTLFIFCIIAMGVTLTYYLLLQKKNYVETKATLLQAHYDLLETKYNAIHTIHHDMKNHLICIHGLATSKNLASIIHYIEDLQQDMKQSGHTLLTGNKVLDIILNDKLQVMSTQNIVFNPTIEQLDLSFIADQDLVAIVSNLMDNAIESASKSTSKLIDFKVYAFNNQQLVIKLVNSCDTSPKTHLKSLLTTKKNAICHGYGVKNIYRTVDKYKGHTSWNYDLHKKQFSMTIMMCREASFK